MRDGDCDRDGIISFRCDKRVAGELIEDMCKTTKQKAEEQDSIHLLYVCPYRFSLTVSSILCCIKIKQK